MLVLTRKIPADPLDRDDCRFSLDIPGYPTVWVTLWGLSRASGDAVAECRVGIDAPRLIQIGRPDAKVQTPKAGAK